MRVRRIGKRVAFGSCQAIFTCTFLRPIGTNDEAFKMYDALSYKFGPSNRHQKYWRSTMQTYRELKRINGRNLLEPFETLATVFFHFTKFKISTLRNFYVFFRSSKHPIFVTNPREDLFPFWVQFCSSESIDWTE
jgi:hypothetical protein